MARSPTARGARRTSPESRSSTCPHSRRRCRGPPRSLPPAAVHKRSASSGPTRPWATKAKASPIVEHSDGGTLVAWASCARSSRRISRSSTSTSATGKRRRWPRSRRANATRSCRTGRRRSRTARPGLGGRLRRGGRRQHRLLGGRRTQAGRVLDRATVLGPGLATQALAQLLDVVDARPLHAYVAKSNVASIRVLEKCGFVKVGEHAGDDGIEEPLLELRA